MGGSSDDETACPSKNSQENSSSNRNEGSCSQTDDEVADKSSLKKARYVWQIKGNYHLKCSSDEKESSIESECLKNSSELKPVTKDGYGKCFNPPEVYGEDNDLALHEHDTTPPSYPQKKTPPTWYRPRPDWPVLKWQTRQVAKAFVDNTINCVLEDMGFVPLPADSDDIIGEELPAHQREQSNNSLEDRAVLMAIQSHGLQRSDQNQDIAINAGRNRGRNYSHHSYSTMHCENSDLLEMLLDARTSLSTQGLTSKYHGSGSISPTPDQAQTEIFSSTSRKTCDLESCFNSQDNNMCNQDSKKNKCHLLQHPCTCRVRHSGNLEQPVTGLFQRKFSSESLPVNSEEKEIINCHVSSKDVDTSLSSSLSLTSSHSQSPLNDDSLASFKKRRAKEALFSGDPKKMCSDLSFSTHSHEAIDGKVQSLEHFDFMDAAVAAAIQKKGLSALACTEYG